VLERIDCAGIGAGVVGLAVARQLALAGREVIVLEAASAIGSETSSRNSEVIHAGIYYPPGSLKARLCVAGRHALYRYCEGHGVPHARPSKLLLASRDEEVAKLDHYLQTARANGVEDLRRGPQLLAGAGRRCAAARLHRHPAQDLGAGSAGGGFHDPRTPASWCAGPGQPVRDRIARTDRLPGDRRLRGGGAGGLNQ
jgi:glycine/D-amino acid oxidase-like deaminating enzyme